MKLPYILFIGMLVLANQALVSAQEAPKNLYLADSPWPTYHGNSYRQSYSEYKGPVDPNKVEVKIIKRIKGGTSPWTYLSSAYPNGERALLQSNATHFYKIIDNKQGFRITSRVKIDSDWLKSFGWNFLQTKENTWFTYDPKYNPKKGKYTSLYKIADQNPSSIFSKLIVKDSFSFKDIAFDRVQHFGLNYLGQIAFYTGSKDKNKPAMFGLISQDFDLLATLPIHPLKGEIFGHNAFPIDEENSMYVVTTHRLIQIKWDGKEMKIGFEAYYDFVNDGPTGRFAEGSGTTPTLMGTGRQNDQLIIVADGHKKNNLLAFWRVIPKDWKGISGEDPRLAGIIQLPAAERFSNKFQSIENSPTVYGYDIAIAQFNGFLGQGKKPLKGVQKVRWNTEENKFELQWVNTSINMNGVLTYSKGSNLVYSSGREDGCKYYYYGLDWDTGALKFRKFLGKSCKWLNNPWDDGGGQQIIDEKGNIYFVGGASLIKLENTEVR